MASVHHIVNAMLCKNENFKFVACKFPTSDREYTYKTLLDVKEGDQVLVDSPSGMQIVVVKRVLEFDDVDLAAFDYKWIMQIVDMTHFESVKQKEQELIQDIRRKMCNKIADGALESLYGADTEEQVKKLVRL